MAKNGIELTGDWKGATLTLKNLNNSIRSSGRQALKKAGLYAEGQAKRHLSAQDLPWRPLKPETVAQNIRKGESTNILTATSTYFQNITSFVSGDVAFAGVRRTVKTRDGDILADIARVLEYGSRIRNIEARPLWKPVRNETKIYLKRNQIFQKLLKRKLGI